MARIAGIDIPRNKRVEIALTYIFFEDWKLKIIALIYGRFDLIAFCGELTLRF